MPPSARSVRHRVARALAAALAAALVVAGCGRPAAADLGMSDSTYVDVLSRLRAVADAPDVDSTTRAARRAAVLRSAKLDAAALERASRALVADPERATTLWRRIDERAMQFLNAELARRDSARRDSITRATAAAPRRR